MDGSTQSPEYLGVNPKGRVPALAIDGQILTEAPAIMTYLALTNPDNGLLGNMPIDTARALEWMNWMSSGIHALAIAQNWRVERFSDDEKSFDGIRKKGMVNLRASFELVEGKLHNTPGRWAVADRYSIVDPYLLVFFRWGNRLGLDMKSAFPQWTKHAQAMLKRQAVLNALTDEDIDIWA